MVQLGLVVPEKTQIIRNGFSTARRVEGVLHHSLLLLCLLCCPSVLVVPARPVRTNGGRKPLHTNCEHQRRYLRMNHTLHLISIISRRSSRTYSPKRSQRTLLSILTCRSDRALLPLNHRSFNPSYLSPLLLPHWKKNTRMHNLQDRPSLPLVRALRGILNDPAVRWHLQAPGDLSHQSGPVDRIRRFVHSQN